MRTRRQPLEEETRLLSMFEQREASDLLQQTSDNRTQIPNAASVLHARRQTPVIDCVDSIDSLSPERPLLEFTPSNAAASSDVLPTANNFITTNATSTVTNATTAVTRAGDLLSPTMVQILDVATKNKINNKNNETVDSGASDNGVGKGSSNSKNGSDSNNDNSGGKRKRKNLLPTPTSGLTATQIESAEQGGDGGELTPLSGKRCCKSDLKRCLRVGDWIENIRVPRHILETRNGGKKLLAQFDGQNFIDYQTEKHYRSISDWIKQRMLDLGAISETSNISGWDYAVVHRDGRTTTLRLLVEETKQKMELMRSTMKEQCQSQSPLTPLGISQIVTAGVQHQIGIGSGGGNHQFLPSATGSAINAGGKFMPTFGGSNVLAASGGTVGFGNASSDVLLHNRLLSARQQVAELEQLLYVGRSN